MRKEKRASLTLTDLQRAVDALDALIWTMEGGGRCDFANGYWSRLTGLQPEAVLGHGWQSAIHPDDLVSFHRCMKRTRKTAPQPEASARVRRFDGQYRWFSFRASPTVSAARRKRWCWIGMHDDESPSTDARMRRFFDILPWQAGFLSAEGILEFTNLRSLRDFGMTHAQLEAWTKSGIIHKDDHAQCHRSLDVLLRTGEVFDEQLRMLYPDGTYRWTRSRCVPVRDAAGNTVRHVSFQIDVDDLKRAEDLLAAEVKVLEMIGRGEPLEGILVALAHHVEGLCDDCLCNILLVESGDTCRELIAESSLPGALLEVLRGGAPDGGKGDPWSAAIAKRAPVFWGDLAGDRRWEGSRWVSIARACGFASCWAIPVLSGAGSAIGVVVIHRRERCDPKERDLDVIHRFARIASIAIQRIRIDAARVSAEAALNEARLQLAHLARTATLSAMSASITHEISQPIFGVLTNANTCAKMLSRHPPDVAGAAETTRRAIRDANRAFEVIKRLRAMFANRAPTLESVDLNEAAREVIAMSSAELRRSGSVVQAQFSAELPSVRGDRVQLQQVILNLVLNAADAMADIQDRPRTLRIQTVADGGDGVKLLVQDSGIGLDPEAVDKPFEAFYTTKSNGLGIGLAVSRSIIESHNGKLWASVNEGPGATFCFRIPCAFDASSG